MGDPLLSKPAGAPGIEQSLVNAACVPACALAAAEIPAQIAPTAVIVVFQNRGSYSAKTRK